MIVEVFKTSVESEAQANELMIMLLHHFPDSRINFDLQDCDKVLRIEGTDFTNLKVVELMGRNGIACTVLD